MKKDQTSIILDSIADGVFTIDLEWRITTFNNAAEQITGIRKRKPLARTVGRFLGQIYARDNAL